MLIPIRIYLNTITLIIISNNFITGKNCNIVTLLVFVVNISVLIFYYLKTKPVVFLIALRLWIVFKDETISRIVYLPFPFFILSHVVAFLIFEHCLPILLEDFITILLISSQFTILIFSYLIPILINMLFILPFSDYSKSILIIWY
jgi:hypothetical protein